MSLDSDAEETASKQLVLGCKLLKVATAPSLSVLLFLYSQRSEGGWQQPALGPLPVITALVGKQQRLQRLVSRLGSIRAEARTVFCPAH